MKDVSIKALVIAFGVEFCLDWLVGSLMLGAFAGDSLVEGMSAEDLQRLIETIIATKQFLLTNLVSGTATSVLGGFMAARLGKVMPYYHGLCMGIIGVAITLFQLGTGPVWFEVFAVLMPIPASIYGAHLAKKLGDRGNA